MSPYVPDGLVVLWSLNPLPLSFGPMTTQFAVEVPWFPHGNNYFDLCWDGSCMLVGPYDNGAMLEVVNPYRTDVCHVCITSYFYMGGCEYDMPAIPPGGTRSIFVPTGTRMHVIVRNCNNDIIYSRSEISVVFRTVVSIYP
jgi:hypothetical protein